jgi:hypothetical protein
MRNSGQRFIVAQRRLGTLPLRQPLARPLRNRGLCATEIAQLVATTLRTSVRFPVEARYSLLLNNVQNSSGIHPASYPIDTEAPFPGVKLPGRELVYSPPSTAEVHNLYSSPSTFNSDDQVKEDQMGKACSTNGGEGECI